MVTLVLETTGDTRTSTMENILIITDSRGKTLENFFSEDMLSYVDIRHFNGLTIHELNILLPNYKFIANVGVVYIMVGINDFTALDKSTHTVRLVTPFESGLILRLKNEINLLNSTMKKYYPAIPFILCPIYGLDLNVYSKLPGTYRYQDVLDRAITKVNRHIGKVNTANSQVNPFLNNIIHRYRPKTGEYITLYERLSDGLHPSTETQRKIANYLIRSFVKFREVNHSYY